MLGNLKTGNCGRTPYAGQVMDFTPDYSNGEQKLTTECIENVIMMVTFSAIVLWTFEEKIGNGWKKILWKSGKIAFVFSVSIEMLQLLLRLGTFQLSDIFYAYFTNGNPVAVEFINFVVDGLVAMLLARTLRKSRGKWLIRY